MNTNLERIRSIKNFPSLVKYLRDELDWEFETDEIEDLTYDYDATDFHLVSRTAARIHAIKQLRPLIDNQLWGIFYLDFAGQRLSIAALRGILRGLVAKKRASSDSSQIRKWQMENLLFICTSNDFRNFNFAYFRGSQTNRAVLSTFGWQQGDTHLRTLAEYNLPALRFPVTTSDAEGWLRDWRKAFDVEAVTDKFFADYRKVFESVEREVEKSIRQAEAARLYTQRLFNRLMFLYFIQKKGWLDFEGDKNYLRALFNTAVSEKENFLRERLYYAFFWGMSNVGESREAHTLEALREKRGDVPYLNGGLFDIEDDYDSDRDKVHISNDGFSQILDLFERYNFTVEESTPLNVQVAVDPEMLGKVFEELVTGRHESGSYYTPRQIVSFMCREALKHYLAKHAGVEEVARFVDAGDAVGLVNPESILEALRRVRVCDPACGSGAYLLGMMQELVRLRGALFVSQRIGDDSAYKIKRSIIENNLYGVDKDPFAVQIAALRLWLSLAIDADQPQPLPNLDFKIGCGDSLISPAPSVNEKSLFFNRRQRVRDYVELKNRFASADGEGKRSLREQIEGLRVEIAEELKHTAPRPSEAKIGFTRRHAEDLQKQIRKHDRAGNKTQAAKLQKELQTLKRQLAAWDKAGEEKETGFDWAVEFAEVFMPEASMDKRIDNKFTFMNDYTMQPALIEDTDHDANTGGFDIVLANPPYVRMELFKPIKPILRRNFPAVHSDRADLYVYFYDRAQQLLKDGGIGAFISPNKWLRAGYGENLRQQLLDAQAVYLIVDFGDLPVFKATAYPSIIVWQKQPREDTTTTWAVIENLQSFYHEGVREYVNRIAHELPASQFGKDKSRLIVSSSAKRQAKMEASGQRLKDLVEGRILYGIKTGLNEAFVIDGKTRHSLIKGSARSSEVIKPLLAGDDVRHYTLHFRDSYLLYMYHGINIDRYSAVENYLKPFRKKLESRATRQEWYELQQPQSAYVPFFSRPKIIYPQISMSSRFCFDTEGYFINQKCFVIPNADWYILGVLNSDFVWQIIKEGSPPLRGGYSEPRHDFMLNLLIPDAPTNERERVAWLARETQGLHTARRQRVEQFLRDAGMSPAASSSRNPLEQPWALTAPEFARRAPRIDPQLFIQAHDETLELTERMTEIEREIDERVAALYGVESKNAVRQMKDTGEKTDIHPFA
jgi:type I restriction-modification system DNA methylase subunit